MKRVLVAGELNVDIILQGPGLAATPGREVLANYCLMTLGSASAICAMGLAKLGTPVSFIGIVGADAWGDFCLDAMRGAGIDLTAVRRERSERTGLTVAISSPIDRALVTFPGTIGALAEGAIDDVLLRSADHLHVSSYFLQEQLRPGCARLFARATAHGLTTSLDPGCDPSGHWLLDRELLQHVDLFLPNEVEIKAIAGCDDALAAVRVLSGGRTTTVAKLGQRGAVACDGNEIVRMPALAIEALDSTGAGDSFNAGFLHAWLGGATVREALRLGTVCGGLSTLGLGGTAKQPTRDEVEGALRSMDALEPAR
jgi:sugar/nucleoside kinase (ribokinase family)